jgi:hypothetical protein
MRGLKSEWGRVTRLEIFSVEIVLQIETSHGDRGEKTSECVCGGGWGVGGGELMLFYPNRLLRINPNNQE